MKQKCFTLILAACTLLCVVFPLSVSASESSHADEKSGVSDFRDLPFDSEPWSQTSEAGFANDLIILMALYPSDDFDITEPEEAADLLGMELFSTELEPYKFYHVELSVMAVVDDSDLSRYDDLRLQIRFPQTLAGGNAIGYATSGEGLEAWADAFGISSTEPLDLYYIADSGKFSTPTTEVNFQEESMDALFSSERGIMLQPLLANALARPIEVDGHRIVFARLVFTLYTAPHEGEFRPEDMALDYWVAQKLMLTPFTPAPAALYATATLKPNGRVSLPYNPGDAASQITLGIVVALVLALIIGLTYITLKVRRSAHERGITGFRNICLDVLNSDDEYSDK